MSQVIKKLQDGGTTPQTEPEVKLFQAGRKKVDLNKLLKEADSNVESYADSQNWSPSKKQAFLDAYSNMSKAIESGQITQQELGRGFVDSTGQIQNSSKRGFDAYGAAAQFFDTALQNQKEYVKPEAPKLDDFDSKAFDQYFNNEYFGGNEDISPEERYEAWTNLDALDKKTNKRGYQVRARKLAELLPRFIEEAKSKYDFSKSAFKSWDNFNTRAQEAIKNLSDGEPSADDKNFLYRLGINAGNYLGDLQESDRLQAQQAKVEAQKAKDESPESKQQKILDQINQKYGLKLSDTSQLETPFLTNPDGDPTLDSYGVYSGDRKLLNTNKNLARAVQASNIGNFWHSYHKYFLNGTASNFTDVDPHDPLYALRRSPSKTLGTLLQTSGYFNPKNYSGETPDYSDGNDNYYFVQGTYDKETNTGLVVSPTTKRVMILPVLSINYYKMRASKEFNPEYGNYKVEQQQQQQQQQGTPSQKDGGTLKFLFGGVTRNYDNEAVQIREQHKALQQQQAQQKQAADQKALQDQSAATGRTPEQIQAGQRTLESGLTATDWTRLGAIGADILSMTASFIPGYGTAASAVLGAGSSLANFGADVAEDGLDWGDVKNLGIGLGADAVGLVPGLGASGKIAKIGKTLMKYAPIAMAFFQAQNMPGAFNAIKKGSTQGFDKLTVDDWRQIGTGITGMASMSRLGVASLKMKQMKGVAATGNKLVTTKSGKQVAVTEDQLSQLKNAKNLEEANKILKGVKGAEGEELSSHFRSGWNPVRTVAPNPRVGTEYDWNRLLPEGASGRSTYDIRLGRWATGKNNYTPFNFNIKTPKWIQKVNPFKNAFTPENWVKGNKASKSAQTSTKTPYVSPLVSIREAPNEIPNDIVSPSVQSSNPMPISEFNSSNWSLNIPVPAAKTYEQLFPRSSKITNIRNRQLEDIVSYDDLNDIIVRPNGRLALMNVNVNGKPTSLFADSNGKISGYINYDSKLGKMAFKGKLKNGGVLKGNTLFYKDGGTLKKNIIKAETGTKFFDWKKGFEQFLPQGMNQNDSPYAPQNWSPTNLNGMPSTAVKPGLPLAGNSPYRTLADVTRTGTNPITNQTRNTAALDALVGGRTIDELNNMQNTHAKLFKGWNADSSKVQYNPEIESYQKTFNDYGFNTSVIQPGYDKRYAPVDGSYTKDSPTGKWTADGYGGNITFDRNLGTNLGYMKDGKFDQAAFDADNAKFREKGYEMFINPENNYINYRKYTPMAKPDATPEQVKVDPLSRVRPVDESGKQGFDFNKLRDINATGIGRLAGSIYTNNKIARITKSGLKPLLLDPNNFHKQITGDLAGKQQYYNQANKLQDSASKAFTSDASLQLAGQLDAQDKSNDYREKGDILDNSQIAKTRDEAWNIQAQGAAERTDVANKNRASMIGIEKAKKDIDAGLKAANWNSWENWFKEQEAEHKQKVADQKQFDLHNAQNAYSQNYQDRQNAIKNDPRLQYLIGEISEGKATEAEKKEYQDSYSAALNSLEQLGRSNQIKLQQDYARIMGLNYNVPKTPFNWTSSYKGGGSVEAAQIKADATKYGADQRARTKYQETVQKNMQEGTKNTIKMINNLSSVTKKLILKSMTYENKTNK